MQVRNLVEMLQCQADRLGPRPALRYKKNGLYHDISWNSYWEMTQACAAALIDVGLVPGERVGLLSENRVEWLIADMGLMAAGAIGVPPHAPLTARQVQFQLADAEVAWLFVSTRDQLNKIRQVRRDLPSIRGIVVFESNVSADDAIPWKSFVQLGRAAASKRQAELAKRQAELGPDDLATIIYTSGTTGIPKGVMLTHGNLLSNAGVGNDLACHHPDDLVLGWLPLSHIYARTVDHYGSIAGGLTLALAESAETVVDNLKEVQPTNMAAVPRFYEKVLAAVASPDPEETGRRLRSIFGPRIDWISSGGAPLPIAIGEAYHAAGILLLPGYGLTESSPVISFNSKSHWKLDTVGLPIPGVEVRIAPDGEILTRGPHVMKGYWRNSAATEAAIKDGWLYTGDLGALDEDGYLVITGRKKELLVLSNGKKVVPSHLEGLLVGDHLIDQAVVCGEGRNYLTALLVPNWESVRKALADTTKGLAGQSNEELTHCQSVRDLLRKSIDRA
ncbi:MAG TPA: long-chain fatty acid--CoA ligase, partial [Gemmataceae bacterium]|nr:long-chain fatty acid--CoA ligase [Gemmataceae bacterium]